MNNLHETSIKDEINQIEMKRPHVVILGAGASRAAFPNGDNQGRKIPLMNDLVETVKLGPFIEKVCPDYKNKNFEDIYSMLSTDEKNERLKIFMEKKLYDYFSNLEYSYKPGIYDHLVLSLRETDLIATFNWDPFLMEAYRRNQSRFRLPRIVFLHGNVTIGYCENDAVAGLNGNRCSKCRNKLIRSPLLFPVKEKNYNSDWLIANQWRVLSLYLKDAFMITIFGYRAPETDVEAIKIMKKAWGADKPRTMEQIEIITKPNANDEKISKQWSNFTYSHHYEIKHDFYESWIANHPRRTGEAYLNQYIYTKFIKNNPIPKDFSYMELWNWLASLKKVERAHQKL